jgi:2-C-methyl-D-erythritol 4-phosphate cytidylyltransferase
MSRRCFALIPAAGVGARSGSGTPKQYANLNGLPMLFHTLRPFVACDKIAGIRVVLSPDDAWHCGAEALKLRELAGDRLRFLPAGGATRAASVANGLEALATEAESDDWVLVHDAARPCITPALINHLIDTLAEDPVGGLLAIPVADTVKRMSADQRVSGTVSRDGLWLAQTPQMFRLGLLRKAYQLSSQVTDEAGAVEGLGLAPLLVTGSVRNIKVTFPDDFRLAEHYLSQPD